MLLKKGCAWVMKFQCNLNSEFHRQNFKFNLILFHGLDFQKRASLRWFVWSTRTGSSAGKESTCNAGDPSSNPGLRWSTGEGIGYPLQYSWASLVARLVKKSACNAGDPGSIPGLGQSPEEENSSALQYSAWRIPWTI